MKPHSNQTQSTHSHSQLQSIHHDQSLPSSSKTIIKQHHQHSNSNTSNSSYTEDVDYSFDEDLDFYDSLPHASNSPITLTTDPKQPSTSSSSSINNTHNQTSTSTSTVPSKPTSTTHSSLLPNSDLTPRAYSSINSKPPSTLPRSLDWKFPKESVTPFIAPPLSPRLRSSSRRPTYNKEEPDTPKKSNPPSQLHSSSNLSIIPTRYASYTNNSVPIVVPPPLSPSLNSTLPSIVMSSRSEADEADLKARGIQARGAMHQGLAQATKPNLDTAIACSTPPTIVDPSQSSEPPLPVPISPEVLLMHVRQMRYASKKRQLTPNHSSSSGSHDAPLRLPVHSRAGSNTSSTSEDNLQYSIHSPQFPATHIVSEPVTSDNANVSQSLSLPLPSTGTSDEIRPMAETLDLSHQRIADLTQPVVEELAEYVERLALGYNYLPVLPDHFAILGESLRYLNLRGNHMEVFPEVLTRMPSLEILDVSRNKIKAFPRRPGTLERLRVLSVSRNRIRRLPNYVANLSTLRVLKLDHNPVVWPPRDLVTFVDTSERVDEEDVDARTRQRADSNLKVRTRTSSNETSTAMAQWLRALQDWMRQNPYIRPVKSVRPSTADPSSWQKSNEIPTKASINGPHLAHSAEHSPISFVNTALPALPSTKQDLDHSRDSLRQHNRNASSSSSSQWVRKRPDLRLKKSLPDLRRNHGEIMVERRADADRSYSCLTRLNNNNAASSNTPITFLLNSPLEPRSAQSSSGERSLRLAESTLDTPSSPALSFHHQKADLVLSDRSPVQRIKHAGDDRLAGDRNSGAYFRRLSMLPASTISKEVPVPLLKLMDAIRGILFSLSQIYAALKQFVVFATQDRLPGALSRVMSAADDAMSRLINSLDRFDSSTRRSQPDGEVVQEVLTCCRDNVTVFGKLVNVLSIQLKVLTNSADVRYSRTLLLTLYGATAEIAMSWSAITPLVDNIVDLLKLRKPVATPAAPRDTLATKSTDKAEMKAISDPDSSLITDDSLTGNHAAQSQKVNGILVQSSVNTANLSTGLTRSPAVSSSLSTAGTSSRQKGRRHAGSFSVEDVQLGAILPPASAGLSSNFPVTPTATNQPPTHATTLSASYPSDSSRYRAESSGTHSSLDPIITNGRSLRERSGSSRVNGTPTALGLPLVTIGERDTEESRLASPLMTPSPFIHQQSSFSTQSDSGTVFPRLTEERGYTMEETMPSDQSAKNETGSTTFDSHQSGVILSQSTNSSTAFSSRDFADHSTFSKSPNLADMPLSRTDQDFLDMTEATIDIAISVSSMMLENLGQATSSKDSRGGVVDPGHAGRSAGDGDLDSSPQRDRRLGEMAHGRQNKAIELKELCELEIEIIKRLRLSLAQFWASRPGPESRSPKERRESTEQTDDESVDSSGSKVNWLKGQESRRVYEDATAFVKAVIQTANLARTTMNEYPLSKAIREGLGELTKATKELATLLAVSSFKPTATSAISTGTHASLGQSYNTSLASSITPNSPACFTESSPIEPA